MSTLIVSLLVEFAVFVLLWLVFRRRIRRFFELEKTLAGLKAEVQALVVDFTEASERNISLLEDRIAILRDLVDEAEASGARAAVEGESQSASAGDSLTGGGRHSRPAMPEYQPPADDEAGKGQGEPIVFALGHGAPETASPQVPARSARTEAMDLYRAGFSSDVIAPRLGLSVAEVELIIGLEERRGG